jgi:hypothetical protein
MLALGIAAAFVALWMSQLEIPYWLIPAGFGLALCGFFFGDVAPSVVAMEGDADTSTVSFSLSNGETAVLPRSALGEARVTTHTSSSSSGSGTSTSYGVALGKRDGGMLHLCRLGGKRDVAQSKAEEINALLDTVPVSAEREDELVAVAQRRLEESPRVIIEQPETSARGYRGGGRGALEARWPVGGEARTIVVLPAALGGMITAVLGMLASHGTRPVHALVVIGLLLVASTVQHIRQRSRTQVVHIDERHLALSKRRDEDSPDAKRIPLTAVNAIDVAWSGPLMVRVDEANEEIQQLFEKVSMKDGRPGLLDLPALIRGVLAIARQSIQIPTGSLRFQERLDLETVLGAEIAERTGREIGQV